MDVKKAQSLWARLFGWIGLLMFVGATFQTFVSLFWIGSETVKFDTFKAIFASIGFIFALANRQLGNFANLLGRIFLKKLEKWIL